MSRPRKQPRCTLCTQHRWKGNSAGRHKRQRSRHKNPKNVLWQNEYHRYQLEETGELEYDPDPYDGASYDDELAEGWWLDWQEAYFDDLYHDEDFEDYLLDDWFIDEEGNRIQ